MTEDEMDITQLDERGGEQSLGIGDGRSGPGMLQFF